MRERTGNSGLVVFVAVAIGLVLVTARIAIWVWQLGGWAIRVGWEMVRRHAH